MMKIFLFTVLIICGLFYIDGCVNTDPAPTDLTYVYIQHTAFTIDTSLWTPNDHTIKYTVTMQNIGTETATNIRTQLFYKKPSAFQQSTNYLIWLNRPDTTKVEIPPGGSFTYEVTDTAQYIDSVTYWNLSYNSNTIKNRPYLP